VATYAIGDVQGCFGSLMALLQTLQFDPTRDRLWFAGDLVNRGPRSLETLRFVRDLGERAVTVLGNHDVHLLGVACGSRKLKAGDTLTDVLEAPDRDDLISWLRRLPLLHRDADRGVSMVHAGLPPQWTLSAAQACAATVEAGLRGADLKKMLRQMSDNGYDDWSESLPLTEQAGYILNCLTRMRYCDALGRLDLKEKGAPGSQRKPYLPWFAVPGRLHASETLVFGHWASLGVCDEPGVHALDTGCVWGGTLTALCLETRERTSVPCHDILEGVIHAEA
jgi:bis(5'-nucleosyl)-tetraphosphatase (symmetrical)